MTLYNKKEILAALENNVNAFTTYIASMSAEQFVYGHNGKWSPGQNLDHLIGTIQPLQLAFSLPTFLLKILFGTANRPSKSYEGLVEKYKSKLLAGGKASGRFIPSMIAFEKKDYLIQKYEDQKVRLIKKIKKQQEEELDKYILPHPLIGKITLREMLFFTIYHNEHHLHLLINR